MRESPNGARERMRGRQTKRAPRYDRFCSGDFRKISSLLDRSLRREEGDMSFFDLRSEPEIEGDPRATSIHAIHKRNDNVAVHNIKYILFENLSRPYHESPPLSHFRRSPQLITSLPPSFSLPFTPTIINFYLHFPHLAPLHFVE